MQSVFRPGGVIRMRQFEFHFNNNINDVVLPLAIERFGEDRMILNEKLAAFNRELVSRNKGKCLLYFAYSVPRAAAKLFYCSRVLQLLCPTLLVLFVVRRWICRQPRAVAASPKDRGLLRAAFWIAVLFYFAKTTLVILALMATSRRYVLPAGVFVPALVALLIVRELELIYTARQSHTRGVS